MQHATPNRCDHSKPSICFVAHFAYGALAGIDNGHAGGIERQQATMCRWLAVQGYRVSMVTWNEGQVDGENIDGVRVYRMCRRDAGVRGLRFIHPRWTSLWRALSRADADLYYYNCGDMGLGQVAAWCRRHGRRCIYSVASNPDCEPNLPMLKPKRERILYRYGLHHVHQVIAQTKVQQKLLREGFGIASVVLPMPCRVPDKDSGPAGTTDPMPSRRVLWVGRFSREKRLEWLLDLAERCAELSFDVVGHANTESEYSAGLVERAAHIDNVRLHGRLPWESVVGFYRRAFALCCTSAYEGFPNTFLEAWSHGVPVVSTFDPDGRIGSSRLGVVAHDVTGLTAGLRELFMDRKRWKEASSNARSYFEANHTFQSVMPRFTELFHSVWRNGKADLQ